MNKTSTRLMKLAGSLNDEENLVSASWTDTAIHFTAPALNLDHITVIEGLGLKITDIRPVTIRKGHEDETNGVYLILKEVT